MARQSYSDKLKDPRWQKKRLKILERDDWVCKRCGEKSRTLHVHHMRYIKGKDPWDYPDWMLLVLCDECHEYEKEERPKADALLLEVVHEQFLTDAIESLAESIGCLINQNCFIL